MLRMDERYSPDLGKPHLTIVPDPPHQSRAADILDQAKDLVDGDRHKQHGKREDSIVELAARWGLELGMTITPRQVCRMMIDVKQVRDKFGEFNPDNAIDIAGYAAMGGEFGEKE